MTATDTSTAPAPPPAAIIPSEGPARYAAIEADPYPWPYDGVIDPSRTALINIDWQTDFCGPGGYVDAMGYDLDLDPRRPRAHRQVCSQRPRAAGMLVIHTREGHEPDLSDLPAEQALAIKPDRGGDRRPRPVRPDPRAWRAGLGHRARGGADRRRARSSTSRAKERSTPPNSTCVLRTAGITHIILTGITTDVCVHTTMREANDRGYECLLLSDCTGATDPGNYRAALKMVTMQGGVFGAVAHSSALLASLGA